VFVVCQDAYGFNADQIIYRRQQGVSDAVITTMLHQPRAGMAIATPTIPAPPPVASPDYSGQGSTTRASYHSLVLFTIYTGTGTFSSIGSSRILPAVHNMSSGFFSREVFAFCFCVTAVQFRAVKNIFKIFVCFTVRRTLYE
jgi:hypothetical protein